jgi:tetratricopeptide (TPR) repeat protein
MAAPKSVSGPFPPLCVLACLVLLGLAGCAGGYIPREGGGALRLSEVRPTDPARRASIGLCLDGLAADAEGRPSSALNHYSRAIQIDPNNPYAYLALARHEVEMGDARRALEYLDLAESLLAAESALSPRVEPHLDGLRGSALTATGRNGSVELGRAERAAPGVWGDGRLSAQELR